MHISNKLPRSLVHKNNLMHITKFTKRLCALATTDGAIDTIMTTLSAGVTSHRVTRKDLKQLVQHLEAMSTQKPKLRAPKADILPQSEKYDFIATDTLGIEIKEGDMLYRRTFVGDIDKLLQ